MKKISKFTVLFIVLLAVFALACVVPPQPQKIGICHATGSATNPYVFVWANINSVTHLHGHEGHAGDIIGVNSQADCPTPPTPVPPTPVPPTPVPPTPVPPTPVPTDRPVNGIGYTRINFEMAGSEAEEGTYYLFVYNAINSLNDLYGIREKADLVYVWETEGGEVDTGWIPVTINAPTWAYVLFRPANALVWETTTIVNDPVPCPNGFCSWVAPGQYNAVEID